MDRHHLSAPCVIAGFCCKMERAPPVAAWRVDGGAVVEEPAHGGRLPRRGGSVQARVPVGRPARQLLVERAPWRMRATVGTKQAGELFDVTAAGGLVCELAAVEGGEALLEPHSERLERRHLAAAAPRWHRLVQQPLAREASEQRRRVARKVPKSLHERAAGGSARHRSSQIMGTVPSNHSGSARARATHLEARSVWQVEGASIEEGVQTVMVAARDGVHAAALSHNSVDPRLIRHVRRPWDGSRLHLSRPDDELTPRADQLRSGLIICLETFLRLCDRRSRMLGAGRVEDGGLRAVASRTGGREHQTHSFQYGRRRWPLRSHLESG